MFTHDVLIDINVNLIFKRESCYKNRWQEQNWPNTEA